MARANPNPGRVTDAMWNFAEGFVGQDPDLEFSGIYAQKPGYHNTRAANRATNYSVRDAQDKLGPDDKAAGFDFTSKSAKRGDYRNIARYCQRLEAARQDSKLRALLREYYGQADSDRAVEGWDWRYQRVVTSDSSHLWHIHLSVNRGQVANADLFNYLLRLLTGSPTPAPTPTTGGEPMLGLKYGDQGEEVKALQALLERIGLRPEGGQDGDFGDSTAQMVSRVVGVGDGKNIDPNTYITLIKRLADF